MTWLVNGNSQRFQGRIVVAGTGNLGAASARPISYRDAGGIALAIDATRILASEPLFARLSGQIGDMLGRQLPVSLRLAGRDRDTFAAGFESICRRLADALDLPGPHTALLEITIQASSSDPDIAWRIRRDQLGEGPLNIICDEHSISAHAFWQDLWHLRGEPLVSTAFWPLVTSPCTLLSPELAEDIIPTLGLQAPTESAWASALLLLTDFTSANGDLDVAALETALIDVVAKLEAVHDVVRWPTAAMRQDAWLNRRLAIQLDGLGDYVAKRGLDPCDHETLQELREILRAVRRVLRRQSQRLISANGTLPAIDLCNPAHRLGPGPAKKRWEQRWSQAVDRSAVRHRNMLILSPWALFPSQNADLRYRDLAPLLRLADACAFRRKSQLLHWNINDFKHFHQGVWALMCQLEANALVAERL